MEEEKSAEPSTQSVVEEILEFRPWVKWCGLGLAGLVSIGLFLGTYYIGRSQGEEAGYLQATCSGMVQKALNEAASQNVLNFMRLASAGEEELLKAAMDTQSAFGWIQEPEVRLEAEWCLADALLDRGKAEAALSVLTPLFKQAPHSIEWAYRALQTGNALTTAQQYAEAAAYYKLAVQYFAENKQENWRLEAMGQLIALAACASQDSAAALAELEKLLSEMTNSDEGTCQLRSMALVHMGELHRCAGDKAQADEKFRAALAEVENLRTVRPEGAVSRGTALLALGDAAAAEPMLRMAENNPGNSLADVSTRLLALRQLAVIEQERGHHVTALALMHRSQGMAEGRVLRGNAFWPCLYDQRGWMHFMVQNYQTALQDFNAALADAQPALLKIQPLEGAARCYMELGRGNEAMSLLEECLKLRQQHAANDTASLGRVNLLLGQILDQQGKIAEAEAAYAVAMEKLPADVPEEQGNRLMAMLGRGYALIELQRWADAYTVWEQTLPLVEDQHDRREEVRSQLRRIKPLITAAEITPTQS